MSSIRTLTRWPGLLPLLAALLCYVVTLDGTFIYDDVELLLEDPRLLDPARWRELFTRSYNGGEDNLYRPLVSLSFLVQHRLHGPNAFGYHLVNVLLHAGATVSVTLLARRLGETSAVAEPTRPAVIAGVLFAVHPVHVEPVALIVGRAELLTTIAVCLALRRLLTPRGRWDVPEILGWFLLGLLSKEHAMILPTLALAWMVARRLAGCSSPTEMRRSGLAFAAMACLLALYVTVRQSFLKFDWDRVFLDWTIQPMIRSSSIDRWTMPLELLGRHVALLVAPLRLSIDHGYAVTLPRVRWESLYPWLGIVAGLALAAWFALGLHRRHPAAMFLALATALSLAIPLNLVAIIGTIFGERLIYLPSAFALIGAGMLLGGCPRGLRWGLVPLLVVLLAARTVLYAAEWSDRLDFYERSLSRQPMSIRLLMLTAHENDRQGRWMRAERLLCEARTIAPGYDELLIRKALLAAGRGEFDLARTRLQQAMDLQPRTRTSLFFGYIDRLEREASDK